ncbi:MAG: F0F1 ATP synthase subunit B [Spirochaetales bacterium]|jgi:F-type H+-transporting ATPase subunit b|nr:F0F1 ATP synthase subunit B [Spirochaetales bacterium]
MLDFSVTSIFTLLNIGLLFIILRFALFKPVTKFMEKRARAIQEDIDHAQRDKEKAARLKDSYENKLAQAAAEAEGIIREAREDAQKQADRIIEGGRTEAQNLLATTRKQLEAEKRAAMTAFQAEAAGLVIAAAAKLLEREITGPDSARTAALLLQELGKKS